VPTIINRLRLREGVTPEEYEAWAKGAARVPRSQPSIADWRLVRGEGGRGGGEG